VVTYRHIFSNRFITALWTYYFQCPVLMNQLFPSCTLPSFTCLPAKVLLSPARGAQLADHQSCCLHSLVVSLVSLVLPWQFQWVVISTSWYPLVPIGTTWEPDVKPIGKLDGNFMITNREHQSKSSKKSKSGNKSKSAPLPQRKRIRAFCLPACLPAALSHWLPGIYVRKCVGYPFSAYTDTQLRSVDK